MTKTSHFQGREIRHHLRVKKYIQKGVKVKISCILPLMLSTGALFCSGALFRSGALERSAKIFCSAEWSGVHAVFFSWSSAPRSPKIFCFAERSCAIIWLRSATLNYCYQSKMFSLNTSKGRETCKKKELQ